MPARRRSIKAKNRKKSMSAKMLFYLALIIVPVFSFFYIKATRNFWNGKDKITIAVQGDSGDVDIVTFDPQVSEIVTVKIPGNTEVEVAQDLGVWKLKSVWELGKKEGLGGRLLTRTITKHFKFPVYIWAESEASGFFTGNFTENIRAAVFPYKTNLGVGDKINIGIFSLLVKNPKRVDINLEDTGYIKEKVLSDGTYGYSVTGDLTKELIIVFSDPQIAENVYRIRIIDATGVVGLAEELGQSIEVLGGKVSSIEKVSEENLGCEVRGRNKTVSKRVALLFPCKHSEKDPEGNFDLEIKIGKNFAKDY